MDIFKKKIYRRKSPINYPKRPKISQKSRINEKNITVYCNLKRFSFNNEQKNRHIMQYSIHYEPVIAEDNYPLKRTLIRQLKNDLEGIFEKYFQAGDTLYICSHDAPEQISLESKIKEVLYKITFIRTSNYIDCKKIVTHSIENLKLKSFLESMIKSIIYSNNHVVRFDNRTFYDYHDSENIVEGSNKGKIWHGYSTAICITESGLFLRINDKNKLITGKTAYEKMLEIARNNRGNLRDENTRREIAEYFRGKTVIAQYGTYRAYKIGEVTMDQDVNNTKLNVNLNGKNSNITIKQYYKNQYNIDIKNEDQPLLIEELRKSHYANNSEIRIRYLIPELVYLTGQDDLDEKERSEILEKSKPQPTKKVELMEKGFKYLKNKEKRKMKKKDKIIELKSPEEVRAEWGINFENDFTEVTARCLSLPNIIFGDLNNKSELVLNRGRFRQKKDICPVNFDSNNCMLITFENLVNLAKNDCEQMKIASEAFGIKFDFPHLQKIENNKINKTDLINELQKIDYNHGKKIIIVVLDKKTKHLYPTIKDYIYSQTGLASQFMLHDENQRGGRKKQSLSYYSGVLNQMVVKANGELFKIRFCDEIDKSPSMIIGIDYSKIKEGTKYIVTATYNRRFNRAYTDMKINLKNEEKDNENEIKNKALLDLLIGALDYFKSSNAGLKPSTIIIYMKGGNERQSEKIIRFILPDILKLFSGNKKDNCYEEGYIPKLTVFSVNKRTELKFFEKCKNGYKNIPLGSVIDQKVINPDVFEFYLQCPEVQLGTASPVHFLCIYNNNEDISLDDFEKITFYQSFYYWNWTGPIRIPAVLKYAELANSFSSKNLKNDVLKNLKSTPYFI